MSAPAAAAIVTPLATAIMSPIRARIPAIVPSEAGVAAIVAAIVPPVIALIHPMLPLGMGAAVVHVYRRRQVAHMGLLIDHHGRTVDRTRMVVMDDTGPVVIVVGDDHAQHGAQYAAHRGTVITVDGMADEGAGTGADDRARQFVGSRAALPNRARLEISRAGAMNLAFMIHSLG